MKLSSFFSHWRQDLSSDQVANMYKIRGVDLPIGFFRTPEIHKELVAYGATLVEVFDVNTKKWYPAPYIQCKNCKKIKKWFHFRGDRLVNNSIKRPYMDHVCGDKNLRNHQIKQEMLKNLQMEEEMRKSEGSASMLPTLLTSINQSSSKTSNTAGNSGIFNQLNSGPSSGSSGIKKG